MNGRHSVFLGGGGGIQFISTFLPKLKHIKGQAHCNLQFVWNNTIHCQMFDCFSANASHINSNPKKQEQNTKSWEDCGNKSHQQFFEYVSGELRACNFIHKKPGSEENAYSQQHNCQMRKYRWIYWRNIPCKSINLNLESDNIKKYQIS